MTSKTLSSLVKLRPWTENSVVLRLASHDVDNSLTTDISDDGITLRLWISASEKQVAGAAVKILLCDSVSKKFQATLHGV